MRRAYDFDDTLNEFTEGFVTFMQTDVLGILPTPVVYGKGYHLMEPFVDTGLSTLEALKMFEASGKMIELIPPTKSKRLLDIYLSPDNSRRDIVTARAWMEAPEQSVRDYFEHWNLPQPDGITVVDLNTCKSDILREWEDLKEYYEDHPGHLFNVYNKLGHRIRVVAANRPCNEHLTVHDRM